MVTAAPDTAEPGLTAKAWTYVTKKGHHFHGDGHLQHSVEMLQRSLCKHHVVNL